MLIHSFAATMLKRVVLGSAIAVLYACGGGTNTNTPEPDDTSPDSFVFNSVTNATPGAEIISNEVVISGIDAPTAISATGGSYAIAGGSFTSAAGTITNGQSVRLKVSTVAAAKTLAEASLTVGGTSATFSVTTAAEPPPPPPPSSASSSAAQASSSRAPSSSSAYSRNAATSSAASSILVVPASSMPASSIGLSSSARSSTPKSSAANSSASSRPASSSAASSSIANSTSWLLDSTNSYLNFISTKNTHTMEVSHFTGLTGDIDKGVATLVIDLNSVNSGIALRDQRLRDLLFQTTSFPTATATVNLPADMPGSLEVGVGTEQEISVELDLHGVKTTLTTRLSVQKLGAKRLVVQSIAPVLIKTSDHALVDGIEALRAAVGIASISAAVPVDFTLVFDAR